MDIPIAEWLSILFRWGHIITGIAWIGSSFYFIWLDQSLRNKGNLPDGVHGESWSVHGGGFYQARKFANAPSQMPEELHWFKYESYFTWISGFLLMAVLYYWGAESFLIDPAKLPMEPWQAIGVSLVFLALGWIVYDLLCKSPIGENTGLLALSVFVLIIAAAYGLNEIFSGRAAYLHVGAMIGGMMTGNVFFIIIPNQKKSVVTLKAGGIPDPKFGKQAKQRSTHNNYLTLPVLLLMLSNHYPMLFGHQWNWVIVAFVIIIGGIVRDFFNAHNGGAEGFRVYWQWPTATAFMIALVIFVQVTKPTIDTNEIDVTAAEAMAIMQTRCVSCHASKPTDEDIEEAPGGVKFESLDEIRRHSTKILAQTVFSKAMPLGNKTGMTGEERQKLGAWIRLGMPSDED
jgi:uncharacterized membrane protein